MLQVRTNVRNKYKNYHKPALLAMLTPKRKLQADLFTLFALLISLKFSSELPDGTVVAKRDNPAYLVLYSKRSGTGWKMELP